jgi:SAM-dependent methyltransferase
MSKKLLPKCPICGGNEIVKIGNPKISSQAAKLLHTEYKVVKCKTCRFYYVYPEISLGDKEWEKLYGTEYFSGKTSWWKRKRCKDRKQRLNWLQECCNHNITRFLDIGCGEGYTLLDASKRGWSAYGIDISDNRVDSARMDNITFWKKDIFQAAFPNDFFDCIYMDSVLEHLIDPYRHLLEIKRILRKGGTLYIGVPNEDCLFNDVKRLLFILMGKHNLSAHLYPFKRPFHVIGFTKDSLFRILDKSGFEIIRLRNFAGEYEWRKHKCFTKQFLVDFFLLPVHLLAIPLKRRIYMDTIVRKGNWVLK